ncbi:hypothetical protein GCK72_023703 [Caenorhabditis remanei]|uniref:Uncharacterized protein n=1 Tax=Caenorhabditis remanei TaxID=31234 RepID=A0A6A5FXW4_CAERE|nr:hypothetical protein GCK72_023703 [Caenorhabditis remanei]KAF1747241.1 hypothetical protein GCK72_023703 [Caenorhabditis remanei]
MFLAVSFGRILLIEDPRRVFAGGIICGKSCPTRLRSNVAQFLVGYHATWSGRNWWGVDDLVPLSHKWIQLEFDWIWFLSTERGRWFDNQVLDHLEVAADGGRLSWSENDGSVVFSLNHGFIRLKMLCNAESFRRIYCLPQEIHWKEPCRAYL